MKCPNCGKVIADDSVFCEFCGTKLSREFEKPNNVKDDNGNCKLQAVDTMTVKDSLVVLIMYLIIIFSLVEFCNLGNFFTDGNLNIIHDSVYRPATLYIGWMNFGVFIFCLVLAILKKIRISSAVALCVMSAMTFIGAFYEFFYSRVYYAEDIAFSWITSDLHGCNLARDGVFYFSIIFALYLVIAKWKKIKF